jgi:hypothetical protein
MNLENKLRQQERFFKKKIKEQTEKLNNAVHILMKRLIRHLENNGENICEWKESEIPKTEPGTQWLQIEQAVDQAIDEKISNALQQWEIKYKYISQSINELLPELLQVLSELICKVEEFERDIQATRVSSEDEHLPCEQTSPGKLNPIVANAILFGSTTRQSVVNIFLGPVKKVRASCESDNTDKYEQNKKDYITGKTKRKYLQICEESEAKGIIIQALKAIFDYLRENDKSLSERMALNKKLIEETESDKRSKDQIKSEYEPLEKELIELFNQVALFGRKYIIEPDFDSTELNLAKDKGNSRTSQCLYGTFFSGMLSGEKVTLKQFKGLAAPGVQAFDKYFMERNLRLMLILYQCKLCNSLAM